MNVAQVLFTIGCLTPVNAWRGFESTIVRKVGTPGLTCWFNPLMNARVQERLFEIIFSFFILSFFLTLGSVPPGLVAARMIAGGALAVLFLPFIRQESRFTSLKSIAAWLFLSFFLCELIRAGWAGWQIYFVKAHEGIVRPLHRYLTSPGKWFFYLVFFLVSLWTFRTRRRARHLLWVLSGSSFFLALNALPFVFRILSQMTKEQTLMVPTVFFHPVFYFQPWVKKFVLAEFSHVNYIGDVIALGFFSAVGLFLYNLHWAGDKDKRRSPSQPSSFLSPSLWLPAVMAGSTALASLLFLGRGTMLSFFLAFLFFLIAVFIKYPSRKQMSFTVLVFLVVFGFLYWFGNWERMWEEVATVQSEVGHTTESRSTDDNREGIRRALTMFRANPLWGVGTDGYGAISEHFALPGTENSMANLFALCHYAQVLAEEGCGAIFYFLFLIVYFFESLRGLRRAESRFQFFTGIGLFAPVFMVLTHALVSQLMQRFTISMLVYILMGASLSVLSKDFDHD